MRLGTVIGRVTLSQAVPALQGGRWLIVSPFTREHFQRGSETPPGLSKDPSLVVYDDLGGGVGQTIGFIEGREAAQPFAQPTPIDAINAALVDEIFYSPFTP
jgi:carbon dioxide concentrating mechanism protein CcmL